MFMRVNTTLQSLSLGLIVSLFVSFFLSQSLFSQETTVSGVVTDKYGPSFANVFLESDNTIGTATDYDGKFLLKVKQTPPFTIVISSTGMAPQSVEITQNKQNIEVFLEEDAEVLEEVRIVGKRIGEEKQKDAKTVVGIDNLAIKEAAADNFYNSLGTLAGVDVMQASLGFSVINTRGFNSTSPVRSLQTIDGVDNQAPGLNFSLGNFLGAPEIDVNSVDLVVGAASAYYGPNAFNGVLSMKTKDPFYNQGLSLSGKVGERAMMEGAIRYARAFGKEGNEKFAFKVTGSIMRANDWEADNYDEVFQENADDYVGVNNPGGYDAVNIYGDEFTEASSDRRGDYFRSPALGRFHRTGYKESDVVDYNTRNLKLASSLHYRVFDKTELIVGGSYGTGTTVYQGDNRFSLNGLKFYQGKVELKKRDKFFIRAYTTQEDAGGTYDAYFTALKLQEMSKDDEQWALDYGNLWIGSGIPGNFWGQNPADSIKNLPDYPDELPTDPIIAQSVIDANPEYVNNWHTLVRDEVDGKVRPNSKERPRLIPGTPEFNAALDSITSLTHVQGGTGFYDKSGLYHVQGEYTFTPTFLDKITVGGNFRQYTPKSRRTIFDEELIIDTLSTTAEGIPVLDTTFSVIRNSEFGFYAGVEKVFLDKDTVNILDNLIFNATLRMDKNQNFDYLFSPAASMVYVHNPNHIFRFSASSAIRNPTLTDQYLFYNVGRAILRGNIDGDSTMVTIPSLRKYLTTRSSADLDTLQIPGIQPEKVLTFELGYRTTLGEKLYLDANYYTSFYRDFIGYNIGVFVRAYDQLGNPQGVQVYRVAANAKERVVTQGLSLSANYYIWDDYALTGNYSWNKLTSDVTDPIVPAYNTPEHKFNIGFNGRNLTTNIGEKQIKGWGFNVNYKWIQGFVYEGSPQFTGNVPTYSLLDAQINYRLPTPATDYIFKIGASNILNNEQFQVYGGPRVGRLAYFSVNVHFDKL